MSGISLGMTLTPLPLSDTLHDVIFTQPGGQKKKEKKNNIFEVWTLSSLLFATRQVNMAESAVLNLNVIFHLFGRHHSKS